MVSNRNSKPLKLRHYEKATKFEKKSPTCFDKIAVLLSSVKTSWRFLKFVLPFSEKLDFKKKDNAGSNWCYLSSFFSFFSHFFSFHFQANAVRGVIAALSCAAFFVIVGLVAKFRWRPSKEEVHVSYKRHSLYIWTVSSQLLLHCIAYRYAVWPAYNVKCLYSRGWA